MVIGARAGRRGRRRGLRARLGGVADRARREIERAPAWQLFLVVVGPLLVVYLATATYGLPQSPDPRAAALPAWQLAERGTLYLDAYAGDNPWLVETRGRVASNRQPGVIGWAVPFYALAPGGGGAGTPPMGPAGVAAAVSAALAMGVLAVVLARVVPSTTAVAGAYVAGLATATWTVSADALWPHGPAQLALALGMLGLAGRLHAQAGLAFGAALLIRPNTAVVAAVTGLYAAWRKRSPRPAIAVGLGSGVGLAALVAYNALMFGEPSIAGGYPDDFTDRLATMTLWTYVENVVGTLVSPGRGVLVLSPFLLVLAPGLVAAWRAAPDWVRGSALAGLVYMALHLRMNRFWGGTNFFSYRYPLEALTLAAPLLALAWRQWASRTPRRRWWFTTTLAASVAVHALGALQFTAPLSPRSPWREPALREIVTTGEGPLLAVIAVLAVAVVALVAGRAPPRRRR